jgi:hypothetical protein
VNPINCFGWLKARRRILWVDLWHWWATKGIAQLDDKTLAVVKEAIRDHAPGAKVIHNDRGAYRCEDCDTPESILVKTDAKQSKPHDCLCATCFLDRLLLGLKAERKLDTGIRNLSASEQGKWQ